MISKIFKHFLNYLRVDRYVSPQKYESNVEDMKSRYGVSKNIFDFYKT